MPNPKPCFIITVDTEPDDLWSRPRLETTENVRFLPRFQRLCEERGFKPVYLTDYAMARDEGFRRFGCEALRSGNAEIGMHLHAWSTPPLGTFGRDEAETQPYLVEYPDEVMRSKIASATGALKDAFGAPIASHRAGRWAFDERYLAMLEDEGYLVDCSVTPGLRLKPSSSTSAYRPLGYEGFPRKAYFMDRGDVGAPGDSGLLEVPVTIERRGGAAARALSSASRRVGNRLFPTYWFRPDGANRERLLSMARRASEGRAEYVEFMLHSSELMPGGSPYFGDAESIERLYGDLTALFDYMRDRFEGVTLTEYRERFIAARGKRSN